MVNTNCCCPLVWSGHGEPKPDSKRIDPDCPIHSMPKHDVLCQCGWGLLNVEEDSIPQYCPVCGFDFWAYAGRSCED